MEFAIKTIKDGNKELYVDGKLYGVGTQKDILLLINQLTDDIGDVKKPNRYKY